MDLFGPTKIENLGRKIYAFVIVDDFSRYTQVLFLTSRDKAITQFVKLCKKLQNRKGFTIAKIRSDHGGEFENHAFQSFYEENGISTPRTPQKNGVIERKNRTLQKELC